MACVACNTGKMMSWCHTDHQEATAHLQQQAHIKTMLCFIVFWTLNPDIIDETMQRQVMLLELCCTLCNGTAQYSQDVSTIC